MTSLATSRETMPKEASNQTSEMYYTIWSPFKKLYILGFPDSTPFLVEVTNVLSKVRFLFYLEHEKHNTRGEHYISDRLIKGKKQIKRTAQKRSPWLHFRDYLPSESKLKTLKSSQCTTSIMEVLKRFLCSAGDFHLGSSSRTFDSRPWPYLSALYYKLLPLLSSVGFFSSVKNKKQLPLSKVKVFLPPHTAFSQL